MAINMSTSLLIKLTSRIEEVHGLKYVANSLIVSLGLTTGHLKQILGLGFLHHINPADGKRNKGSKSLNA